MFERGEMNATQNNHKFCFLHRELDSYRTIINHAFFIENLIAISMGNLERLKFMELPKENIKKLP
jgi:hypothetical protein